MPTRYVNPNAVAGGNGTTDALSGANAAWTSLSAAEGEITAAALTSPWIIVCKTGGNADTTRVTISGSYTPTATNYIRITVDSGSKHALVWDNAKYRLAPTTSTGSTLSINEDYVIVEGLQIEALGGDAVNCDFLSSSTVKSIIRDCIIRFASGTGLFNGVYGRAGDTIVERCIIYGFTGTGNTSSAGINARNATASVHSYNNVIYGCANGLNTQNAGVYVARNTVCFGSTTSDFTNGGAGTVTRHYCVSGDATAGTTNNCKQNQTLTTGVFSDVTNRNFHLLSSDTILRDAGQSLSSNPDSLANWSAMTTDGDGNTLSGTWDIGADEYAAAGGTVHDLAGTASASSSGSALLTLILSLSGLATASSSGSGTLRLDQSLSGSASGQATASGTLHALRLLTASGVGSSSGSASLTRLLKVAGVAPGSSSSEALLTKVMRLLGSASAASSGDAYLVRFLVLSGAAPGTSSAVGDLMISGDDLVGIVTGSSSAEATLVIRHALSGSASAASSALADVHKLARLAGIATASSSASAVFSADLSGFVPDPQRTIVLSSEDRRVVVIAEVRKILLPLS